MNIHSNPSNSEFSAHPTAMIKAVPEKIIVYRDKDETPNLLSMARENQKIHAMELNTDNIIGEAVFSLE